jgi:hypothetical protein
MAPNDPACPRSVEEGSALVLGIWLQLWESALSFRSLSFEYKSIVFPFLLLSTFGMVGFLIVLLASSGVLVHSDCSQWVVVRK